MSSGGGFPNSNMDSAVFPNNASSRTLTLGQDITVGTISFANIGYVINSDGNSLNFTTAVSGNPTISGGQVVIHTPVNFDDLVINGTMVFDGGFAGTLLSLESTIMLLGGANSITTLQMADDSTCRLINGGTLSASTTVSGGGTLDISALSEPATQPILDLVNSDLSSAVIMGQKTLVLTDTVSSYAGIISGSGGLTISSSMSSSGLSLTNVNTYFGLTQVNDCTFSLVAGGQIASTGPVDLNSSVSTFSISNADGNRTIGDLIGASGSLVDLGSNTLTAGSSHSTSFQGSITGDGGFTKAGSGSLTFSSTDQNSYLGQTTVRAGALAMGIVDSISSSTRLQVDPNGAFGLNNFDQEIQDLSGAGNITLGSATLTVVPVSSSTTFSGTITGTGGVKKNGATELVLSGTNDYLGTTLISEGALSIAAGGQLAPTGTVNVASNASTFSISTANGARTIGDLIGASGCLVDLGSNTLTAGSSHSTSFQGSIFGDGGFTKDGSGTLTFSTDRNAYLGETIVHAGTLQMGIINSISFSTRLQVDPNGTFDLNGFDQSVQDLSGAGNITLGSATLTVEPVSSSTTFSGSITGSGGLTKNSGTELILSGTNDYLGATLVAGGGLRVTGTLTSSSVTVGSNSVLTGTGTVQAPVEIQNNGILLPGNSIGTLTVDTATFDSGGSYLIQITPTTSSLLVATGTIGMTPNGILIDPGAILQVFPTNGEYSVGDSLKIAETLTGVISGASNFRIESASPGFNFSVYTDPTDHFLFLLLMDNVSVVLPTSALSGNRKVLAGYLNSIRSYSPLTPVFEKLSLLFDPASGKSSPQLNQALDLISPARNAFSMFAVENVAFSFNDILASRSQNWRLQRPYGNKNQASLTYLAQSNLPQSEPLAESEGQEPLHPVGNTKLICSQKKYSVWAAPFGEFAHQHSQKQTPAFDLKTGGILLSFDAFDFEHALVGCSAAYAYLHLDESGGFGKAWMNDYALSFYASYSNCGFYGDFALWGGYYQTHNRRDLFFLSSNSSADSEFHGWQIVPHLEFGYDFFFDWIALEPYVRIDWAVNFENGFEEHGASPLNMQQQGRTGSLLRSEIGLSCYQSLCFIDRGVFIARESLSYVNQTPFWNNGFVTAAILGAPGGVFTVETLTATQNLIAPGLELFYQSKRGPFVSLTYEGEFSGLFWNQTAIIKGGLEF